MPIPKVAKESLLSLAGILFILTLGLLAKEKSPVLGTIFGVTHVNADAPAIGGGGGGDESGGVPGDFGCCVSSCDGEGGGGGDGGAGGGGGDGGAGGGGGDACVIKGTEITMRNGQTKSIELVRVGDIVWALSSSGLVQDTVIELLQHDPADHPMLILLKTNYEDLIITGDHHVMTSRGWLRADSVRIGDTVYRFKAQNLEDTTITEIGYQYSKEPLYTIRTKSDNYIANGLLIHTEMPYQKKSGIVQEIKPAKVLRK